MNPDMQGYALTPAPTLALKPQLTADYRWLWAIVLVGALTAAGIVAYQIQGPRLGVSFSASVAFVYAPLAAVVMLFVGWTGHGFPLAAALFYGFLGLSQAAGATYLVFGDRDGAITLEMVLALPLLLLSWLAPGAAAAAPGPRVPAVLKWSWILILLAGVVSTVLARSPAIAAYALLGRFVLPILVTLGTFRRLRDLDDYKVVWWGFVTGMAIICIFNFQRAVIGETRWYAADVSQRYAGATGSFAIPMFYVLGPALWLGHALALRRSVLRGTALLAAVGVFGVLLWIGAHRGPLVFLALLLLWWAFWHVLRHILRVQTLVLLALGGGLLMVLVRYALTRTAYDVTLITERFAQMAHHGATGEARWHIWQRALDYWTSSPIWGVGLNNWVVVDDYYESVHSTVVGILFDTGIFGAVAFGLLFGGAVACTRKAVWAHLPYTDQRFFLGCRAGWVVMMLLLATNLPLTSGQPRNYIFAYAVYFFPMLVMLLHARHPPPQPVPPRLWTGTLSGTLAPPNPATSGPQAANAFR